MIIAIKISQNDSDRFAFLLLPLFTTVYRVISLRA